MNTDKPTKARRRTNKARETVQNQKEPKKVKFCKNKEQKRRERKNNTRAHDKKQMGKEKREQAFGPFWQRMIPPSRAAPCSLSAPLAPSSEQTWT
jgi:hypothetical protein